MLHHLMNYRNEKEKFCNIHQEWFLYLLTLYMAIRLIFLQDSRGVVSGQLNQGYYESTVHRTDQCPHCQLVSLGCTTLVKQLWLSD